MFLKLPTDFVEYTLGILEKANTFLPLDGCNFLADKAYDVKNIYNTVRELYSGNCYIPLNLRNTKNPAKLPCKSPICEGGLAMYKCGKFSDSGRTRQKFCCPYKSSKKSVYPCNHKIEITAIKIGIAQNIFYPRRLLSAN